MKTFMRAGVVFALLMIGVLTVSAQDNPQLPVPDDVTDLVTTPGSLLYTTTLSTQEVVDFYTNYLTSVGFTITMNLSAEAAECRSHAICWTGQPGR